MKYKHAIVALLLLARTSGLNSAQDEIAIDRDKLAKFIPVALEGYTGEVLSALRFDLEIQGFEITSLDKAQYHISGSNASSLVGRVTDWINKASLIAKEYTGGTPRTQAHAFADEIVEKLANPPRKGVARTKIAFKVDTGQNSEIYMADYDGENQRRLTVQKSLNINAKWSPDARSIAYSSYRRGVPNIFISNIFQGTLEELTKERVSNNVLPSWSPDGTRLCFASTRDGNFEIYVVNRDGSNLRRLTNHPSGDLTCTWSPSGTQIAFTSDRTGTPQIYIVGADGLGLQKLTSEPYADRATWSPAPFNEVAYSARTGPGNDIKVISLATREVRQLTFGEGTNESPSWAPNGRHLAFTSTRSGKTQVFTIARDGKNLKQITRTGNNYQPDWSR